MTKIKKHMGIGVLDEPCTVNGKRKVSYTAWQSMLTRCYSARYQEERQTYIGCSVCPGWLTFSVFSSWFDSRYSSGYQLDKDLLYLGNKVYSPLTCCLIPTKLNSILASLDELMSDPTAGSFYNKRSRCWYSTIRMGSRPICLGSYSSSISAGAAWRTAKLNYLADYCSELRLDPTVSDHIADAFQSRLSFYRDSAAPTPASIPVHIPTSLDLFTVSCDGCPQAEQCVSSVCSARTVHEIPTRLSWDEHRSRLRSLAEQNRAEFERTAHKSFLGSRNSQAGTFWITDGIVNKKWHDNKGDLPPLFHRGRVVKF